MIRLFLFCFILLFCSSCTSPVQEESSFIIDADHLNINSAASGYAERIHPFPYYVRV